MESDYYNKSFLYNYFRYSRLLFLMLLFTTDILYQLLELVDKFKVCRILSVIKENGRKCSVIMESSKILNHFID